MRLKAKVMLILSLTTLAACDPTAVLDVGPAICLERAGSIAWLLDNGERNFVLALDAHNTLAGGCG